jgi:nucleoside-diphosphate-sugar epimerase
MSKNQLLIFPTTNSGYGIGTENIYCDEESSLNPVSLYGKLKVKVEKFLMDNTECISYRFATLFGTSPRMRIDLLVNDFTYKAVTDGFLLLYEPHFKRNFLHVRDASSAFSHGIANYDIMKGNTYNVGLSNANLSKEELCRTIKNFVPLFQYKISEIGSDPDKRNYIVSNKKIELSGFKTQYNLDDGIVDLIDGYKIIKRNQYSNI